MWPVKAIILVLVALSLLGGCSLPELGGSDDARATLDVAQREVIEIGEVVFGSEPKRTDKSTSCADQPAYVSATWDLGSTTLAEVRPLIAAAAERRGWARAERTQAIVAARSIDGIDYRLVATSIAMAAEDAIVLRAHWADKAPC